MTEDIRSVLSNEQPHEIRALDRETIFATVQRRRRQRAGMVAGLILVVSAGTGVAAQSVFGSADPSNRDPEPGFAAEPDNASSTPTQPAPSESADPPPKTEEDGYDVEVAAGVSEEEADAATAFLAFAANPSETTSAAVPFAEPEVTISFGSDAEVVLVTEEIQDDSSWFLNDGEGTSSALFVISNSLRQASKGSADITFQVSTSAPPLCDAGGKALPDQVISLYEASSGAKVSCAEGYRVDLAFSGSTIRGVDLSVRAP